MAKRAQPLSLDLPEEDAADVAQSAVGAGEGGQQAVEAAPPLPTEKARPTPPLAPQPPPVPPVERQALRQAQAPAPETLPAALAEHAPQPTMALPPIPVVPKRDVMIQLSIKAPLGLVDRLERMRERTGAQKQAVIAAALDAYLRGHGY